MSNVAASGTVLATLKHIMMGLAPQHHAESFTKVQSDGSDSIESMLETLQPSLRGSTEYLTTVQSLLAAVY